MSVLALRRILPLRTVEFVVLALLAGLQGCGGGTNSTSVSNFDGGRADVAAAGGGDATMLGNKDAGPPLQQGDSSVTGCTPKTCASLNATCGPQGDGCGGVLACGTCTAPQTCGGAGIPNVCGAPNLDAGSDGTVIPTGPLTIAPLNQAITVPLGQQSPTVTYTAQVGGQSVSASFALDLGQVAIINASTGVLTPSGVIGGVANVSASFGTQTVSTPVTISLTATDNGAPTGVDAGTGNNAGGNNGVGGALAGGPVSSATQTLLTGTPTADPALALLYPYDKTVWPQGVLPPLLQWTGPRSYDAVYVHLHEKAFDYQGFFAAPAGGAPFVNVPILKSAWDTLAYSNQGDPVTVTVVLSSGGVAYGPLTETWTIAQGTLTGTVYYQSYGTALAINYPGSNGYPNFGGATLAIKHGATGPELAAGSTGIVSGNSNCRVCHSVAAGGSRLVTQHGDSYASSSSYALAAPITETVMSPAPGPFGFPAIAPDGTFLFTNVGPFFGINPPATSGLFALPGGAPIASSGLPAGLAAATPSFSPDGKHIAFNHYNADKVSIASIDFTQATNTFANLQTLHTPAAGTDLFPAFLPTNDAVVYQHETVNQGEFGATRNGVRGELWWVDLATHTAAPLAKLNGVGYLPTGGVNHTADETLQYEPTVNPVPSGGYAWVVFTSRRLYGNVATQDPFLSDPRNYNATKSATTKKLWVAAIDLNAPPGSDPSHPAFYLPAQELLAGNSRGYWVVDPCEANGVSCLTGDQCCSGYCGQADGGTVCGVQPPGCAVLGNKCAVNSDCCGSTTGISCIDGFCAEPGKVADAGACTPKTCAGLGFDCGPAGDGCGGLLECGTCAAPTTCGGGGSSGVCGGTGAPP
jgi:hypothetical protein